MFKIISKYKGGQFEVIDSASSYEETLNLKHEYELAFMSAYTIEIIEE